ncbi:MAG: glutamine synthetase [Methanocalculus sp. MSAO_Arc1]|nr:glutamine synthetase [Methanocalculus sp. AMF5]RQD79748.1 MAG: glutamine synthetase [Methanocalculus sp. MSAO_Arc1]
METVGTDLNPNEIVRFLNKPPAEFTREDLIRFVRERGIEMLNFRYAGEDGRLKTLNFVITGLDHLESILTDGERIDGSQLFSCIEAGSSDLYVIPKYRTAFINPFAEVQTLEILCSFYTSEGKPLESDPSYILRKAHQRFREETGSDFHALAELEYYVISEPDPLYPVSDQRGYHESRPFTQFEAFRVEALRLVARAGGKVKYGHAEVGCFTQNGTLYEQHEIEFLPVPVEEAVDQLIIAKWIVRMLGEQYGVQISFAPKITIGKAGSGLHFHMMAVRDGVNLMVRDGKLSDTAKKMIAGLLDCSGALTAFGNTIPTSYLRLVPHQEAPTNVCWGDRNRSVVVRVPLGWTSNGEMIRDANPSAPPDHTRKIAKQTIELRIPDGSADVYLTGAGLVLACLHGLQMPDALDRARDLYIDGSVYDPKNAEKIKSLERLPASCVESADALSLKRSVFENGGVFPPAVIDSVMGQLLEFQDRGLSERIYGKEKEIKAIVEEYTHIR